MTRMKRCPHKDIRFCPLYHAAHGGELSGAPSCIEGADQMGCGVDHGKVSYAKSVGIFRAKYPQYLAQLEWREAAEQAAEQRKRNMRLSGVH